MIVKANNKLYRVMESDCAYIECEARTNGYLVQGLYHQIHQARDETPRQAFDNWLDNLKPWKEVRCVPTKNGGYRVRPDAPSAASKQVSTTP